MIATLTERVVLVTLLRYFPLARLQIATPHLRRPGEDMAGETSNVAKMAEKVVRKNPVVIMDVFH